MNKSEFSYELPEELIAQVPIEPRDSARLMVLNQENQTIEHRVFKNLVQYLKPGDLLVLNDSKVMPARLMSWRLDGSLEMEFLLLKEHARDVWEVMVRPGKRAKPGRKFEFANKLGATIKEQLGNGNRLVKFEYCGNFFELLDEVGYIPLPHYIKEELKNKERYQTVYSNLLGSAAAPTAGLHFTEALLEKLKELGVKLGFVTLHVGLGTFRPVKTDDITGHQMHEEHFVLPARTASLINETKSNGRRVVAVGTTSCRTLESVWHQLGKIAPCSGTTKLFVYPGYNFNVVDAMITNFHLPESTLIMLVAAFCGLEFTKKAYSLAVQNRYRFFSFGDAMLIE